MFLCKQLTRNKILRFKKITVNGILELNNFNILVNIQTGNSS